MKKVLQVHIFRGDKLYVGEFFDLPIVTQAETLDELSTNLHEVIAMLLEMDEFYEQR